jgi:hypothetical protein
MNVAFLARQAVFDSLADLLFVKTSTEEHFFENEVLPPLICKRLQEPRYRNSKYTLASVESIERSVLKIVQLAYQKSMLLQNCKYILDQVLSSDLLFPVTLAYVLH